MKYTVTSGSQGYRIGIADSLEEAMKLYDQHLDNDPCDDCCIWDENGNSVDDWFFFVDEIIDHDGNPDELQPMSFDEAQATLTEWAKDGVEIPAGMTADGLQFIWNYGLEMQPSEEEREELYQQCIRENDEAEFAATVREASDIPYEAPEAPDPMIEKFQRLLDGAVKERDDTGSAWSELADSDDLDEYSRAVLHRMYMRYQQAQGFLEGITNAIFVAGYDIVSSVDSTKLTVTKREEE